MSAASGGRYLHPVYIFPAGLPLKLKSELKTKFLIAYISVGASIREAMEVVGNALNILAA